MATIDPYKELAERSLSMMIITDKNTNFIYANSLFDRILEFDKTRIISKPLHTFLVPQSERSSFESMHITALENGASSVFLLPFISSDGVLNNFYVQCSAISDNEYLLWSALDYHMINTTNTELVNSLKQAQNNIEELKKQEFKLNFALECGMSLSWEMSKDYKKIYFSDNFEKFFGIKQEDYDFDFDTFVSLYLAPYKKMIYDKITEYLEGKSDLILCEISMLDVNDNLHWLIVRGKYLDEHEKILHGISVDITEQKLYEQKLSDMAYKDPLTGLYKTEYILEIMANQNNNTIHSNNIGLMLIDISQFKDINAIFGHKCMNDVLVKTAERLKKIVEDHLLARIDNNGFMVIFKGINDSIELETMARIILREFEKPLELADHQTCYINLKIGISFSIDENSSFEALFKDADVALHEVKKDGMNDLCFITDKLRKNVDDLFNIGYELRQAIANREFFMQYQPVINTKTKKLAGAEALIRWNHPKRGILSPLLFIPLAEETGLIRQIGDFVLEESIKQLSKWLKTTDDFYLSINFSAVQFMMPNLIERIQVLLKKYSVPPSKLVAEITESIFISDVAYITSILKKLRTIGIRISLDDFGTGYSSLSYLQKIPLDNLKIDRNFLLDVLSNPVSEAILKTIIALGRNLGLTITTEGVETEEQLHLLEQYGCDYIQGFYFSKPLNPDKMKPFFKGSTI